MSALDPRVRSWLVWGLPFVVVAALIGWETEWGRALTRVPSLDARVVPPPVTAAVLPEYRLDAGPDGNRETIERTLFNPTRRPAPTLVVAASKSSMQKGQFLLTGTTVVDQKATAFLREISGGRSRRVQQGETINGMVVTEVRSDRVKLTQNDDSEVLTLRVATGPRTTVQPVVAAAPGQPGQAGQPGQPPQPGAPIAGAAPGVANPAAGQGQSAVAGSQAPVQDVSEVLANRRRAVRAAEAAANQGQPAPAAPNAPAAAPARSDPAWNEVYQRYMQPRK